MRLGRVAVLLVGLLTGCRESVRLKGLCEARTCAEAGATCGSVADGCGGTLHCGSCGGGETCGGGGRSNACGGPPRCVPRSCAEAEATCGRVPDGCGGELACGSCGEGTSCGGGGQANACGRPAPSVPGAPRNVRAEPGNASASVSWSAPEDDGGSPVLHYTVTAEPGGAQVETAPDALHATFSGLQNGTPYTFRVHATNAAGAGPAAAAGPVVPQAPCQRALAPARPYPAGSIPSDVLAADLSGDGRPDLVVGSPVDGVLVLLNRGDGSFAAPVQSSVPFGQHPVTADFDADGRVDVATSLQLTVLRNRGEGRLAEAAPYGPIGLHIAAGDLDGDGWVDLVGGNPEGEGLLVRRNLGGGRFAPQAPEGSGRVSALHVADLNGDGHLDVAYANVREPGVRVLLGRGQGTFAAEAVYLTEHVETESSIHQLLALDLGGDGRPELVAGTPGGLFVLRNRGDGTFTGGTRYAELDYSWGLAAADFDADGRVDLAVTSIERHTVTLLHQHEAGTLVPGAVYPTGRQPLTAAAADFDGDGFADLAVANMLDGSVSVLLNACVR